jgi:hypothetical protein
LTKIFRFLRFSIISGKSRSGQSIDLEAFSPSLLLFLIGSARCHDPVVSFKICARIVSPSPSQRLIWGRMEKPFNRFYPPSFVNLRQDTRSISLSAFSKRSQNGFKKGFETASNNFPNLFSLSALVNAYCWF